MWDTRSRHPNPVLKAPLSTAGHTHPVYSLALLGTQNANSLVSASTDGVVCAWSLDMLARPQETLELLHPAHNKTDEVSITSLGFPLGETSTFWCGTEEGNVYAANRYDRAGAKAGLVQNEVYRGHSGPVTGLDFHPAEGNVDLSDLFLTCGVDWTVKLWRAGGTTARGGGGGARGTQNGSSSSSSGAGAGSLGRSGGASSRGATSASIGGSGSSAAPPGTISPLFTFEEAGDYVYDVRWHPVHPAVFGSVDAAGQFNLWNLNTDTEVRPSEPACPGRSSLPMRENGTDDADFVPCVHLAGSIRIRSGSAGVDHGRRPGAATRAEQARVGAEGGSARGGRLVRRQSLRLRAQSRCVSGSYGHPSFLLA